MGGGKLYDEKQLGMILRRAAELDAKRGRSGGTGLVSEEEIRRVAREAGISDESLDAALAAPSAAGTGLLRALFGGPFEDRLETSVPLEADDEALEDALDEIGETAGVPGAGTVRKGRMRWRVDGAAAMNSGRDFEASATVAGGETRVAVRGRYGNMAGGIFGGLGGGLGVGVGFGVGMPIGMDLGSPLLAIAIFLGALGLSWTLARTIYSLITKRYARKARELLDRIAAAIERSTKSRAGGKDAGAVDGTDTALDGLASRARIRRGTDDGRD